MKFSEFIEKEGYSNSSFMDSGIIDLFIELHSKFITRPKAICPHCGNISMFFIEPGDILKCSDCWESFTSKKSPENS